MGKVKSLAQFNDESDALASVPHLAVVIHVALDLRGRGAQLPFLPIPMGHDSAIYGRCGGWQTDVIVCRFQQSLR